MKRFGTKYTLKKASVEGESEVVTLDWLMSGIDLVNRRIQITGEINEVVQSVIVRALIQMTELSKEPITIYLASPGGDVHLGLSIYDFIVDCPCEINIVATGQIMSMGFIIFLAGDTRIATANTTFMMHSIHYSGGGDSKTVRNHKVDALEGERLNNRLLDIMGERTTRNKKYWYRNVLNVDRYFPVDEAKNLGIIKEPVKVAKKKVAKKVKNVRKKV